MTYPEPEEPKVQSKDIVKLICVVAIALIAIVFIASRAEVKKTEIQRLQAIEQAEIERLREGEVQAQKTERTEERSQFFQKLVPYGKDEVE